MPRSTSSPLSLYAVVPAADSAALGPARRGLKLVTVGPLSAIAGKADDSGDVARRALAHDRVVRRAVTACSSVVPFRLGASVPSEAALTRVIEQSQTSLQAMLDRFHGRVEMGLRIRLSSDGDSAGAAPALPPGLLAGMERIFALTTGPTDRNEMIRREGRRVTFEASYLIPRSGVAEFWSAVEAMRAAEPEFPLLGSGPWAPYSFCASLCPGEAA